MLNPVLNHSFRPRLLEYHLSKIGHTFGRLTLTEFHHIDPSGNMYFLADCECGTEGKIIAIQNLLRRKHPQKSCGKCLRSKMRHPLYERYYKMKAFGTEFKSVAELEAFVLDLVPDYKTAEDITIRRKNPSGGFNKDNIMILVKRNGKLSYYAQPK